MPLLEQLERWKIRGQINQPIIDVVFRLRNRLEHHWLADTSTPVAEMMLFLHVALGALSVVVAPLRCIKPCSRKYKVRSFFRWF